MTRRFFRIVPLELDRRGFLGGGLSFGMLSLPWGGGPLAAATDDHARSRLDETADDIERELPGLIEQQAFAPGVAIALVTPDRVWAKGFGVRKQGSADAVGTRTIFSLQSISKLYTATAALRAYERGAISLNETLAELIPGFTVRSRYESTPEKKITLRHLLSHTAGFTHEAPVGNNLILEDKSIEEHIASISGTWLRFPVGQRYEYSNLGIDLAGYALALRFKTSLDGVFEELLYRPLGLQRTSVDFARIIPDADRATGHDSRWPSLPVRVPMQASGGVYTSIDDAALFVQAHLRGTLFGAETAKLMARPPFPAPGQELGYGLGLMSFVRRGNPSLGHGGGGFGFLTDYSWLADRAIGVAILTNSTSRDVGGLQKFEADQIERLAGVPAKATRKPEPAAVEVVGLARYAGVYLGREGALEFYVEDGSFKALQHAWSFYVQSPRSKPRSLPVTVLSSDTVWLDRGPDAEGLKLRFLSGEDARPAQVVSLGGSVWLLDHGDPIPEKVRADLSPHLKDYVIQMLGVHTAKAKLHLEGDYLKLTPGEGAPSATLSHHTDLVFFTVHGEALDLGGQTPTYANILLQAATEAR